MIAALEGVSFRYGRKEIFQNLNGSFPKGEVVGIIGPNGIGKTTFLKLLAGFERPSKGVIVKNGKCMALLEQPAFYADMTGGANLEYFLRRKLKEEERRRLFFSFGEDILNIPVKKYSMGMRQKLALCLAFLSDAELLLLDEPTNALDQEAVAAFRELVRKEKSSRSIVIASHALEELERTADSVYVISELTFSGKIRISGTEATVYEISVLNTLPEDFAVNRSGLRINGSKLEFFRNREEAAGMVRELVLAGAGVCEVRKKQSFLEECYKIPNSKREEGNG